MPHYAPSIYIFYPYRYNGKMKFRSEQQKPTPVEYSVSYSR